LGGKCESFYIPEISEATSESREQSEETRKEFLRGQYPVWEFTRKIA